MTLKEVLSYNKYFSSIFLIIIFFFNIPNHQKKYGTTTLGKKLQNDFSLNVFHFQILQSHAPNVPIHQFLVKFY